MKRNVVRGGAILVLVALVAVGLALTGGAVNQQALKAPRMSKKLLGDADSSRFGVSSQNEQSDQTDAGPFPTDPPAELGVGATTAADAQFMQRALPGDQIPVDWTLNAISAWDGMTANFAKQPSKNNGQDGVWQNIGPDQAKYPAVLNRTQHEYWDSGRVTSEAISPTCDPNYCRLWVAAAGGGIWRADNALSPNPKWVWVSGSFDSQSIGVLRQDPNDPSGNTIYAGTGEPNSAVDNEAGVGIYKTTDGGDTWTLVPGSRAVTAGRAIGDIRVDPTNPQHYFVGTVRGVRGYTSVCCNGVISRTPGAAPTGLYETTDGGATFNEVWDPNTTAIRSGPNNNKSESRGVSRVEFDPNDPTTIYISAFSRGMWRFSPRLDGSTGGNTAPLGRQAGFKQIWQPGYNSTSHRTMFDLTSVGGKTRIYMTEGARGAFNLGTKANPDVIGFSSFWRTDAADQPAATLLATETNGSLRGCQTTGAATGWQNFGCRFRGTPGRTVYNFCTGQCWYDQDVFTPKGQPNTVYVIGSYQYGEIYNISNSRSILLSTNAGDPDPAIKGGDFSDESWDSTPDKTPDGVHPDQHAIVVNPSNPLVFFEGSDGGLIYNSDKYVDESYLCASRPVDPAGQINCRQLLSRVPLQLYDTLNKGLDTLQFNSLSINPKRPLDNVMGGTQDNGTFEWNSSTHVWPQIMYGDGGQSGYDSTDDSIRFNEFTAAATDSNFHSGDPQWWVVTSGPLQPPQNGFEAQNFYSAIVQDPTVHGQRFVGESHLWRTQDNGGPQAYLESTCPEFTTNFDDPHCGDYVPLGGPKGPGNAGDLASGPMYGADKMPFGGGPTGNSVSTMARCRGDNNTAWIGTDGGRVFVSRNISNPDASAVTFDRIDSQAPNSPARFVSGIWVNTANCNEAWVSYSGYDANTASPPGHVFHVVVTPTDTVVKWEDLHTEAATFNQNASPALDLPITDVVRDDVTGDLYAGTDFGVLKDPGGVDGGWVPFNNGLPRVEIAGLTIIPEARVMYAATHGRGGYRMILPGKATSNNPPGQGTP